MLPRQSHPSSRLLAQFPSPYSCRSGQEAVGLNILPSSDLAAAGMPSSQHGRLSTHRIQPCTGSSSVHAGPLTGYLASSRTSHVKGTLAGVGGVGVAVRHRHLHLAAGRGCEGIALLHKHVRPAPPTAEQHSPSRLLHARPVQSSPHQRHAVHDGAQLACILVAHIMQHLRAARLRSLSAEP